jgi:hypothetical protein
MATSYNSRTEKRKWQAIQVNSGLGVVACLISVGLSGYFAIVVSNPDKGQTYTLAEMKQLMANEVERIKNDPYMPPQAKAMALRAIATGGH